MAIPGFDVTATAPYGLAILRIVLGIIFVPHGWSKLSGGVGNVAAGFASIGVPAPTLSAWVITLIELVGGLFLIVGFLTQIVGLLLFADMLGAIGFAFLRPGKSVIDDRGAIAWEKELIFGVAALCLALAGPGAWSLDGMLGITRG
jgi:putative oxidoreductase